MGILVKCKDRIKVFRDELRDPYAKCRRGTVYEYNETTLGVCRRSKRPIQSFNALKARWPAARLAQLGEDEYVALIEPAGVEEAIEIMLSLKAHRVRQYSDEVLVCKQAAALSARSAIQAKLADAA